jgi:hypothetical protein
LGKATEALEILTNLCEQSGWSWIDGMLLGGCLAYGLEEYHKALDWYSKIILLDSKSVSNLFEREIMLTNFPGTLRLSRTLQLLSYVSIGERRQSNTGCNRLSSVQATSKLLSTSLDFYVETIVDMKR